VVSLKAPLGRKAKASRRHAVRIGFRRYKLRAGRTRTVKVHLGAKRLRQLKRAKKARVAVTTRATGRTRKAKAGAGEVRA